RAKRTADEVELILNDEIRRTYCPCRPDFGCRVWLACPMSAAATVPRPEQTVTFAFLAHVAEERSDLRSPRHHCELVHSGDHHRRWAVVDLLVDDLHRQPGMGIHARLGLAELAARELVTAVDGCSPNDLVDVDVTAGQDFRSAPRA